ncbi:MAG TPA: hypothetical protein VKB54_06905 [Solirubrobacteraceae bacterium]|nr:hypothetical protein [Solirubrobacteraceae bacterium]
MSQSDSRFAVGDRVCVVGHGICAVTEIEPAFRGWPPRYRVALADGREVWRDQAEVRRAPAPPAPTALTDLAVGHPADYALRGDPEPPAGVEPPATTASSEPAFGHLQPVDVPVMVEAGGSDVSLRSADVDAIEADLDRLHLPGFGEDRDLAEALWRHALLAAQVAGEDRPVEARLDARQRVVDAVSTLYFGEDKRPRPDARATADAADACELLAGIDEGEHVDVDRLREVAGVLRAAAGEVAGAGVMATLCEVHEAGACPPDCEHAYSFDDAPAEAGRPPGTAGSWGEA